MEQEKNNLTNQEQKNDLKELALDFTTSSAVSRVNIKFLAVYIPIFWLSGLLVGISFYEFTKNLPPIQENWEAWVITLVLIPFALFSLFWQRYCFISLSTQIPLEKVRNS